MMNKSVKCVLYGIFLIASSISPEGTTTNKSFFSVGGSRDKSVRYSLNRYLLEFNEDRTGGCLEASPFFFESEHTAQLAGAFNPLGHQTVTVGTTGDVNLSYYPSGGPSTALSGSYQLRPTYRVGGMHLTWLQRLDGMAEGFYIMLGTTVAEVWTNPKLTTAGTDADRIKKYFSNTDTDLTNPLTRTHGKINTSLLNKTGFADVDIQFGCRFVENEEHYAGVYFITTVPTGGKVTAENLFDPVLGDNEHYSVGAGINLEKTLFSTDNHLLSVFADLEWRYRITNVQERIVGVKGVPNAYLMIIDRIDGGLGLAAAADYLATDVKVKAGNMLDLMGGVSYTHHNLTVQLGYNFKGYESEFLYLPPGKPFSTNTLKDIKVGGVIIEADNLDFDGASSPTRLNHKLFGALGHIFNKDGDYPVVLGLGGSYNFAGADNNCVIEGWSIFAKLSLGF